MSMKRSPIIAVLGAGIMGTAIAKNIAKGGFELRIWNRSPGKLKALQQAGLNVSTNIKDAVTNADIIITILKDAGAVKQAMESAKSHFKKGAIWLQLSTVGLDGIEQLKSFADCHDLYFYDAPVQGTKAPAEQGQLVVLVSGPTARRIEIEQVFNQIAKQVLWLGEEAGISSKLKLVLNSWVLTLVHGVAESLKLAKALNIDPKLMIDVVSGSPMDSGYFQSKSAAILNNNFEPSFTVVNALKDAKLIAKAADKSGIQMDIINAGIKRFERAIDNGHGEDDLSASFFA